MSEPNEDSDKINEVPESAKTEENIPESETVLKPEPSAVVAPEASAVVAPEPSAVVAPGPSAVVAPEPSAVVAPEPSVVVAPEPPAVVAPEPSSVVAPEPSAVVAPEPSAVVAPEPSAVVAPEPSSVVAPEPSSVVAPEPSSVVAPEPSSVVAPEPSSVVAPEPSSVVAPEPSSVVAPEPSAVVAPKSSAVVAPKSSAVVAPETEGIKSKSVVKVQESVPASNVVLGKAEKSIVSIQTPVNAAELNKNPEDVKELSQYLQDEENSWRLEPERKMPIYDPTIPKMPGPATLHLWKSSGYEKPTVAPSKAPIQTQNQNNAPAPYGFAPSAPTYPARPAASTYNKDSCFSEKKGPGFTASAIAMLDALTSHETIPCNLCDKPEDQLEPEQHPWIWIVDIATSLIDAVRGFYVDEENSNKLTTAVKSTVFTNSNAKPSSKSLSSVGPQRSMSMHASAAPSGNIAPSRKPSAPSKSVTSTIPSSYGLSKKPSALSSRVSFVQSRTGSVKSGQKMTSPNASANISPIVSSSNKEATEIDDADISFDPIASSSPKTSKAENVIVEEDETGVEEVEDQPPEIEGDEEENNSKKVPKDDAES